MGASSSSTTDIEYKDIVFHEKVGQGGFGSVSRVTFKQPYKGYKEAAAKSLFELGEKEAQIMSQLEHPNIVQLIGFSQTGPIYFIIMEYTPQGSLHDYLTDQSKPLPYELKKKWVKESALAIKYLHSMNVLHRDIKPQNCLLFQGNRLKLCDFGLAREIDRSETTSTAKGTFRYMAPEIHKGNEQGRAIYSKPADVYAYGMLILEICTRKPPFDGMEWQRVVFEVGNGAKPTIPEDCPQDLSYLIQGCLNADPKRRPTIETIVEVLSPSTCTWTLETEIHPKCQGKSLRAYRIACCPNGDIVVADCSKLYIIGGDGQYKMPLNSPETHPEKQLQRVYGITVSLQGYIMVVDRTKYMKVFNVSGKYLHCFNVLTASDDPNADCRLDCIATDRAGQILVHDHVWDIITIYTCPDGKDDGKLVNTVKYSISQADIKSMVVNSKSQIVLHFSQRNSVYDKVVATDYSGNKTLFTFTPKIDEDLRSKTVRGSGIACDENDNIYIIVQPVSNGFLPIPFTAHIHKYSSTGAYLECIAKGLKSPHDLSITPDRSLVVADEESILIYSLQ